VLRGASQQTPLVVPQPDNITAWANEAANRNKNVISAQYSVDIAQKSVDIARAGKKPTVDLFASHGTSASRAKMGVDAQSVDERLVKHLLKNNKVNTC